MAAIRESAGCLISVQTHRSKVYTNGAIVKLTTSPQDRLASNHRGTNHQDKPLTLFFFFFLNNLGLILPSLLGVFLPSILGLHQRAHGDGRYSIPKRWSHHCMRARLLHTINKSLLSLSGIPRTKVEPV